MGGDGDGEGEGGGDGRTSGGIKKTVVNELSLESGLGCALSGG